MGPSEEHYDLIVIGSGLGGLSTASLMAQLFDWKVLVLERHYVIGGFTHAFKRPDKSANAGNLSKYEWDVGVHYIGTMREGSRNRAIFDFVTGGKLKWNRMPDPFEIFHYPDFDFHLYGDKRRFKHDLIEKFPHEERAIEKLFLDLDRAEQWSMKAFLAANMPSFLKPFLWLRAKMSESLALMSTKEYFEKNFSDPQLIALLQSQWGTYGLPPSQSPFMMHAGIIRHFMNGGYYPEGGAGEIAENVIPLVESKGGKFLINHEASRILVENGRAIGVEVRHKRGGKEVLKQFHAPTIVSNVGAYNTFARLLPPQVGAQSASHYKRFLAPGSAVTVYLGLKESAKVLGVKGENHWFYASYDHERNSSGEGAINGRPGHCYLSFPSLKNSQASAHTAELLAFVEYKDFETWAERKWQKRGDEYEALKQRIADGLIDLTEKHLPGFKDLIEYVEVSTPLSVEHFTGHPKGAIYGLLSTPERFRNISYGAKTAIPGLYLTGADAFMVGIVPALMSGMMTAGAMSGPFGFLKVARKMKEIGMRQRQPSG